MPTFHGLRNLPLKYSTKGQCFVLPDVGLRPQVMVPPEHIKWLSEVPETILSAHALIDSVGIRYLVPTMDINAQRYIMDVVRTEMTRNLGKLQPDIFSSLKGSVDSLLGTDQENWRHIRLYKTMQEILFKSSNRVFVGLPLCRNNVFLTSSAAFANILGLGAIFVGELLPLVLKPVFGYLLALPIFVAQTLALWYLVPEIKNRMVNIRRKRSDPTFDWNEPKDMLMWVVIAAMDRQDPKADTPEMIAQGLLFLVCPEL